MFLVLLILTNCFVNIQITTVESVVYIDLQPRAYFLFVLDVKLFDSQQYQ